MDWYNRLDVIREKIKFQLTSRKIDTMAALEKYFKELDLDGSGKLDTDEFEKFLARIGIFLTKQELRAVYDIYDPNLDRLITFQEFINPLKEDMNNARIDIVKQAFQVLDEGGKGYIPLEELLKKFNAAGHPRVRDREKSPEEVYKDFEFAITPKADKGVITFDGFMDYYKELSATLPIEKDGYFVDLVACTWNLIKTGRYVTPQHMAELETTLYEKIRQRTNTKEDEGVALRRAITYIDRGNTGAITYDQFDKLLVTIGCLLKPQDVKILFWKYAEPGSGKICADKISNYFALKSVGSNPNIPPKFRLEADLPKDVIEKIKKVLISSGPNGVHEIGQLFKKADASGDNKVDRHEFKWILRENGHRLSELDYERLFRYFDRNHDDVISYEEFMSVFRGELDPKRKVEVYEVFRALDASGSGKMPFDTLMSFYKVESDPNVAIGRITKKDAMNDFIKQWDFARKTGVITIDDFETYYRDVSSAIKDDDRFIKLLKNSWKIPEHFPSQPVVGINAAKPELRAMPAPNAGAALVCQAPGNNQFLQNEARFFGSDK